MTITDFNVAIVDGDSHLSKSILEQRRLDVEEKYCRNFSRYIPKDGVVVDAGACLGDFTMSYAQMVGPNGRVYAIEPNPEAYECLVHNMKPYPNVRLFNVALGNKSGFGRMHKSPQQPENLGAERVIYDEGSIPVKRLDDVLCVACMHRLDFIKIDVEGREPWVIEGAKGLIDNFKPVLLVEVNKPVLAAFGNIDKDILNPLLELGYILKPSQPDQTFDMQQFDVLCLPH